MTNTAFIPLWQYCPKAKSLPLSREDIIKRQVEIEDAIERQGEPIPKMPCVTYPIFRKMKPAPFHAFIMSILP